MEWISKNGEKYSNPKKMISDFEKKFKIKNYKKADLFKVFKINPDGSSRINTSYLQESKYKILVGSSADNPNFISFTKGNTEGEIFKASILQQNKTVQKDMTKAFKLLDEDMGKYVDKAKFTTVDDALKLLGKKEYAVFKNFFGFDQDGVTQFSGVGRSATRSTMQRLGIDSEAIDNLRYVRHPLFNVNEIIRNLGNDSYRKLWNLSKADATRVINGWERVNQGLSDANQWIKSVDNFIGEGKFKKIFGNTQFDHTLTKAFGEGYKNVPKDLLLKGKYTSNAFNQLKNTLFDGPLVGLVNKYNKASVADKPGIQKQINNLFKEFNARTNDYVKEWSPNFSESGKLTFKSSTEPFARQTIHKYDKPGIAAREVKETSLGMRELGLGTRRYDYSKGQLKNIKKYQNKQNKLSRLIFKAYQNAGVGEKCALRKLTKVAEGGRIGFAEGGYGNCMNNAIQEHNKNLQSDDLSVKNAARAKQYGILKNANRIKGMKGLFQMGRKGFQAVVGTGATLTGGWSGVAFEAAIEGLFYEHYRRKGYNDKQAKAETFFYKMMDPDRETGVWEDAEQLLEDELVGKRDEEGYLKSAQPHSESWFDVGADKYQTQKDALEAESAHNDKLGFELGILKNQYRPGSEEEIAAKEQEINDSYDRLDKLQITVKPGTPEQEAYARAEEKQKALQDRRSENWEITKALLDGSIESAEEYERPETYYKEKERQHRDEFLEYKQAERRYRKDEPYAFRESEIEANIGPEEGMRLEWEKYFPRSVDDPRTTEQQKWDYIYNHGGFDLMDRIGIAGGVSKKATGGIASLKTKW